MSHQTHYYSKLNTHIPKTQTGCQHAQGRHPHPQLPQAPSIAAAMGNATSTWHGPVHTEIMTAGIHPRAFHKICQGRLRQHKSQGSRAT